MQQSDRELAKRVVREMTTDLKKITFLDRLIDAYRLRNNEDIVPFLLRFFPSIELAQAIAKVTGRKFKRFIPEEEIRNGKWISGSGFIAKEDMSVVYTFYLDREKVLRSVASKTGQYRRNLNIVQISALSYQSILNLLRTIELEELEKTVNDLIPQLGKAEKAYKLILEQAIYRGASDIHFEFTGNMGIVRIRVAGTLEPLIFLHPDNYRSLVHNYIANLILSNPLNDTPEVYDGRGSFTTATGEEMDLRFAFAPASPHDKTNYRLVIRVLRKNSSLFYSLESLGLSKVERDYLEVALKTSSGLIITSGPTSSGKTTTLYGLLQNIDWGRKVVTIEDPVEFSNPFIWTQHQIGKSLKFADFKRIVLREDPDVILVGEVRDEETARVLVEMANTGHLTLSTIHANNSLDLIKRLSDLGVSEMEIRQFGLLFMAQRLLRKSCPHCRYERELTEAEAKLLGVEKRKVMDNRGCEKCGGTGTVKQRVMILEMLPVLDEEVRKLVESGKSYSEIFASISVEPMSQKALRLNEREEVSISEIVDKLRA